MSTDYKNVSNAQLAALLTEEDRNLARTHKSLRGLVPELLSRVEPIGLGSVLEWVRDRATKDDLVDLWGALIAVDSESPAEPIDEFGSAKDRYEEDWPHPLVTVDIYSDMSPKGILDEVREPSGHVSPGITINLHGVIEGMWIGGGHRYAISNADGSPLGDLQIVFLPGARVDGLKIGTSKGGIDGELRLVDAVLRADDRDVEVIAGIVTKQGDEDDVQLEDEEMHDGDSQGDFAPFRVLDHMPKLHIVAINTRVEVDPTWTGYDGMGIKWAIFLKTCKATFDGIYADAAREHTFYQNNTADLFVEDGANGVRWVMDAAGDGMMRGNGRTFGQTANRVKQDFPKGGEPSTGIVVFKNCVADYCGWEGIPAYTDKDGNVKPGNPNGGGGSDFTCGGHTGEVFAVIDCASTNSYAGSVACWNETGLKNPADDNPSGVRCWLTDLPGNVSDPRDGMAGPSWGTRRFVIRNFKVTGPRRDKQRPPFLLSGMRDLLLGGLSVNGEELAMNSPHIKIDHQKGQTPVETVGIEESKS